MGWNPIEDIKKAANDASKQVDNALGTNLSGRGGGALADLGTAWNRSDVGRWANGFVDSGWQTVNRTLHAVSDVGRGDFKNAGKNLGRAAGSAINVATWNQSQLVLDNKEKFRSAGKYTAGWSEDLVNTASAVRTQADDAYVSPEDRNGAIRFGVKTGAVAAGVYYAPQIGSYLWEAATADPLKTAVVAHYATQGKEGQAKAAGIVAGGLPEEWRDPAKDLIDRIVNPPSSNVGDPTEYGSWRNQVVPGTSYSTGEPTFAGTSSGAGLGTTLLLVGAAGIAAVILRKRGIL